MTPEPEPAPIMKRRGRPPKVREIIEEMRNPPAPPEQPEIAYQPVQDEIQKVMPESELELNYFFTNPQWGDDTVNPELQATLKKKVMAFIPKGSIFMDDAGEEYVSDGNVTQPKDLNLWGNFSFLTRDVRLSNYDKNDLTYCGYYYDLGGDFLNEGFPEAAAISIRKAATRGELSQGRGGFLRKMQNTLISLRREEHNDMSKRSILSGRPKQEEAY